jgi:hypothetical protein
MDVARLKPRPFRAGIQPTIPPQPAVDGTAGYSTSTDSIKKKARITGYEAKK